MKKVRVAHHSNKVIKLFQDPLDSPREWDNLGTIVYKHSRYVLGDEEIGDPIDWMAEMLDIEEDELEKLSFEIEGTYDVYTNKMKAHIEEKFMDKFIALPLYIYDHSGITISTGPFSSRWDSGQFGYIYCTKEEAEAQGWSLDWWKENHGSKSLEEVAKIILEGEVETFDTYLRGEVYGFRVEDRDGEVLDSCGGFYGTDWDKNGILDHINPEHYGWTDEEVIEILKNTKVEH